MSRFARTRVFRGISIIHSSGPQLASLGRFVIASAVIFRPISRKSPDLSSYLSCQPEQAVVLAPFAWGSGPSLLLIMPIRNNCEVCCQECFYVNIGCGCQQSSQCGVRSDRP